LFVVRLIAQFGDGVFQASLAGAVLFNPEHQARASDIAAGFAVVLLPYSLVGPFAGVLIDRWWRQRIVVIANIVRAVVVAGVAAEIWAGMDGELFYITALVVVSVNRFFLSTMSASLPHVVEPEELMSTNAFTTTCGGLATTLGGAVAIGLRGPFGATNGGYAIVAVASAIPYLASSFLARRFARAQLGPDEVARDNRETLRDVAIGLAAGAHYVARLRPVMFALVAIGAQRFLYGLNTVCILLLYRNYFHNQGFFRAGLPGIAQVVVGVAIGGGLAALFTPAATRRWGFTTWPVALLVIAGVIEIGFGLPYRLELVPIAGFGLGLAAQGFKICVDTRIQRTVSDKFRGRVFTVYDTIFNIMFVLAAVVTALALPDTGHSPTAVIVIGVGYLVIAAFYLRVAGPDPVLAETGTCEPVSPDPAPSTTS
jgi:MFS family permease